MKDSLDENFNSNPSKHKQRPNSHEINKRYNHLKENLNKNSEEDLVNLGEAYIPNTPQNKNGKNSNNLKTNSEENSSGLKSSNFMNNLKLRSKSKDRGASGITPTSSSINSSKVITAAFGKLITEKALNNTLRNNFQKSLAKLNDNDTKEVGFSELKNMMLSFNTSEALRIYINLLSISNTSNTTSQSGKEIQVLLIGYMASVFRENLMDPLDKPPNIIKTIVRVTEIIHNFLKDSSIVVHKACSLALQELYDHCMPKDDVNGIILILFDPLITLVTSGSHKMSQTGASVCISDFIQHLGRNISQEGEADLNLKILCSVREKIIHMMTKTKIDNQYIFEAFLNLLDLIPFEDFINNLKEIYERLMMSLNDNKTSYQTKIVCLKILTSIAKKLKNVAEIIIGYYQNEIMLTLQNLTKDRVHKVQIAANEALREWTDLERIHQEIEKKKTRKDPNLENMTKEQWGEAKKMDKFHLLRNLSKMNKTSEDAADPYSLLTENLKEEIYKKGIGNVLKLSNFIKNKNNNSNLRSAGGNLASRRSLSPNQMVKDEIKDYLKKRNVKKFDNVDEMPLENNKEKLQEVEEDFDKNSNKNNHQNNYNNYNEIEESKNETEHSPDNPDQNLEQHNEDNIKENNKEEDEEEDINNNVENKSKSKSYPNQSKNKNVIKTYPTQDLKKSISSLFSQSNNYLNNLQKNINKKLDFLENKINHSYLKVNELKANLRINNKNSKMTKTFSNNIQSNNKNITTINEQELKNKIEDKVYKEMMSNLKLEIEKSMNKEKESPIIQTWKAVMKDVENKNYNNAFGQILNSGDDIYLLRLLCLTGPILNKLNIDVAKQTVMRINMISRSHQIQSLLLVLIETSFDNSLFFKLNKNDQNEILETLYEYSSINSNVGSKAAGLYAKITSFY